MESYREEAVITSGRVLDHASGGKARPPDGVFDLGCERDGEPLALYPGSQLDRGRLLSLFGDLPTRVLRKAVDRVPLAPEGKRILRALEAILPLPHSPSIGDQHRDAPMGGDSVARLLDHILPIEDD